MGMNFISEFQGISEMKVTKFIIGPIRKKVWVLQKPTWMEKSSISCGSHCISDLILLKYIFLWKFQIQKNFRNFLFVDCILTDLLDDLELFSKCQKWIILVISVILKNEKSGVTGDLGLEFSFNKMTHFYSIHIKAKSWFRSKKNHISPK